MKSKKLLLIVLSVVLIMCVGCKKETQLTNCGNNADVQEFENNSKIYIQGNIANVAKHLGSTKLTVDADGDEWTAYFKGLSCTKEIKKYLKGMEDIRCYGNFNKNKSVNGEKVMDIRYIHVDDASKETITADFLRGLEAEKPTEIQTEEPTEKPTEKPTEAPTEPPTDPPTEANKIINNTSAHGFWANGNSDYVAEGLKVTGYAVLHVKHSGDSHFSVISYENGEDYDELLVNTSEPYEGDVLISHSGNFSLEINAEGDWSITSSGLSIDDSTYFSGHGDAVTGITTHDGGNWKITNDADSHFSVIEYGLNSGYMDLLVNTSEPYEGIVKAEKGDNIFFKVSSAGNWTIEKQ